MEESSYSLGLIGFGSIGKVQVDAVTALSLDFQLKALAYHTSRPENFDNSVKLYSDYKEFLNDPDILAVSIATPPSNHFQIVIDTLKAGKHVMVEKPPALTVEECEEMTAFAHAQQKVLFMAFHARYNPAVEAAKKALCDKKITSIQVTYSEYAPNYHAIDGWIFNPKIAGGGVFMDSGINAVSIVTYICPDIRLKVAKADFEKGEGFHVETKAQVAFEFDNGQGSISMDWLNKDPEVRELVFDIEDGDRYVVDIVKNILTKNGIKEMALDTTRDMVDQESEYKRVFKDFALHISQEKSLASTKELAFILDAYQLGNSN